jgi:hypothetical protein
MPEFLQTALTNGPTLIPGEVALRLVAAMLLGAVVAGIYRRTRRGADISPSFPVTLVLLCILIAMVTQVIGDNVARAFSLVGALAIVRFRTVVRDTQDTAYVIFAVVVGMAVGAKDLWVALIGLAVVGFAAWMMMARARVFSAAQPPFVLSLRIGLGQDPEQLLGPTFAAHVEERELMSVATGKQGIALELTYQTRLRPAASPNELVQALNRLEGVQRVQLRREGWEEN